MDVPPSTDRCSHRDSMLETLVAFAFFAFVASVTPGPNNVLLTATGSRVGFKRGLPTLLGITAGFALMIFVLTVGPGSLVLDNPNVLRALKVAGVLMLVYLSYQIAFAPVASALLSNDPGANAPGANASLINGVDGNQNTSADRPVGFIGAAVFQWINPKAWLVVGSAISAYMVNSHSALNQAAMFAAVFFVAGVFGCLPWLAFGSLMQRLLRTERAARWFNYGMGLLLLSSIILIVR